MAVTFFLDLFMLVEVPQQPTERMLQAAYDAHPPNRSRDAAFDQVTIATWHAMLKAAQKK